MAPKAGRKKQIRLQFTPAPSSSPRSSHAHVRIHSRDLPAKRRKISGSTIRADFEDSDFALAIELSKSGRELEDMAHDLAMPTGLPTPAASSQLDTTHQEGNALVCEVLTFNTVRLQGNR